MIIFFLILSILLEATVTTLPLSLVVLLFSGIVSRRSEIFIIAFFGGLLLDILTLRTLGLSSLYFITVVFVSLIYERKFETDTPLFILVFSFVSSFIYMILIGATDAIINSIIVSCFAAISFIVFRLSNKRIEKYG